MSGSENRKRGRIDKLIRELIAGIREPATTTKSFEHRSRKSTENKCREEAQEKKEDGNQ